MKTTKKELKKLADTMWEFLLDTGLSDGHCKMYDPLTIEKTDGGYMLHSYVFDAENGGRHRKKKTLAEAEKWLWLSFREWIDRELD